MIPASLSHLQIQRLGWTLLHFLWQGTVIAVLYAIARSTLARPPQTRYRLACATLTAMVAAPLLTFFALAPQESHFIWSVPEASWQRLLPTVVILWLSGVLGFSIRLAGGWRYTSRLRSAAQPAPPEWQHTLNRIALRLRARRSIKLLVSSLVNVPTVIGWLRPVILVPVDSLAGLPPGYITALLGHEVAHIRRNDYLASVLQNVAEAMLFYHPAVWWISDQIRSEREMCCDDLAVAASGNALTYAQALTALEALQPSRRLPALAANGGSLVNRIRRLLEPADANPEILPAPAAAWTMSLLWFIGIGIATVHAQPAPRRQPVVSKQTAPEVQAPLPLATHARRTLLFDPFLPAQLPQTHAPEPLAANALQQKRDLKQSWKKWLNEDVAYIISEQERSAFSLLSSEDERLQFIEQFWALRDPTPGTPANEFKEEHYRRIAYSNEHFSSQLPGSQTDRGRVYIKFGPPDEMDARHSDPLPNEEWRYKYIDGIGRNVSLQFVDTARTGEYKLAAGQTGLLDQLKNRPVDSAIPAAELPMRVQVDYQRLTTISTTANLTIRFDGPAHADLHIIGRIVTISRRPVTFFEKDLPPGGAQPAVYQEPIALAAGLYRLTVIAKDTGSGSTASYSTDLDVPVFEEGSLAAGSLILADLLDKRTVRPRIGNQFSAEEKLGMYLQLYNFSALAGTVRYVIEKQPANEKILELSEEIASIPEASPSQVTLQKLLPLRTFGPGTYTLTVTATDRNANQTLRKQATFTVH